VIVLLSDTKPRSVNAEMSKLYRQEIADTFRSNHPQFTPLRGDLYAAVYYFHQVTTGLDADNLSKPILDALTGLAYEDDRQVKVRYSGVHDLRQGFGVLALGRIPQPQRQDLLGLLASTKPHTLYVEIGRLHYEEHFRFNSEVPR